MSYLLLFFDGNMGGNRYNFLLFILCMLIYLYFKRLTSNCLEEKFKIRTSSIRSIIFLLFLNFHSIGIGNTNEENHNFKLHFFYYYYSLLNLEILLQIEITIHYIKVIFILFFAFLAININYVTYHLLTLLVITISIIFQRYFEFLATQKDVLNIYSYVKKETPKKRKKNLKKPTK